MNIVKSTTCCGLGIVQEQSLRKAVQWAGVSMVVQALYGNAPMGKDMELVCGFVYQSADGKRHRGRLVGMKQRKKKVA